jgi:hypothetical protein
VEFELVHQPTCHWQAAAHTAAAALAVLQGDGQVEDARSIVVAFNAYANAWWLLDGPYLDPAAHGVTQQVGSQLRGSERYLLGADAVTAERACQGACLAACPLDVSLAGNGAAVG